MSKKALVFSIFVALVLHGCTMDAGDVEPVSSTDQAIYAPGMGLPGYTPVEEGALVETIAAFGFGQIGENFVFLEEGGQLYAYITTTNFSFTGPPTGELTRVSIPDGTTVSIPVLDGNGVPLFGGFMSGIDRDGDDIIFAVAFLDPSGLFAYGSSVYKYSNGSMFEISGGPDIGINGLAVHDGFWYGADTLSPDGVIVYGSTMGGPANVWISHPALAPAAGYFPQPGSCDPPPFGVNGLRESGRLLPCLQSFAVTNVTTQEVLEVPINPDGSAGTPTVMYDTGHYLDDLSQGTCGLLRKDTFVATNGGDNVIWANPYTQEIVEVMQCDGPTAVRTHNGYLYALCAASPLSCGTSQPTFKRIKLDPTYAALCNWK